MAAAGYATGTSSAVVGTTSTPKILHSINWTSGGTAGQITIYDGKDTNGTLVWQEVGTINKGVGRSFAGSNGISLNSGIYVAIDGNVSRFTVAYKEQI